jgi:hypothetical protein
MTLVFRKQRAQDRIKGGIRSIGERTTTPSLTRRRALTRRRLDESTRKGGRRASNGYGPSRLRERRPRTKALPIRSMRRRRPLPGAMRSSSGGNDGTAPDCRATPRSASTRRRWAKRRHGSRHDGIWIQARDACRACACRTGNCGDQDDTGGRRYDDEDDHYLITDDGRAALGES